MENKGEMMIYKGKNGKLELKVKLDQNDVWLTQKDLTKLFKTTKPNISMHIRNIFQEDELEESSVVKDFLTTASDGKNYTIRYYNLDMVLSVGFRVKSKEAIRYRNWARNVLKNHIVKGYTIKLDQIKNMEQSIGFLKESFQLTRFRMDKFLGNIGELARRDVVNSIDDKIERLRMDYESLVKMLKEKKLLQ